MVTLDPDGELISLDKRATEVSRKVTTSLKSRLAVQEALEAKEYSAGFKSALENARITECEVAYYADAEPKSGKTYLYPVYVMTGEGRNPDGEIETFDLMMDGVS